MYLSEEGLYLDYFWGRRQVEGMRWGGGWKVSSIYRSGVMSSAWAASRGHDSTIWWDRKLGFMGCL